jgi:hypothetical protein
MFYVIPLLRLKECSSRSCYQEKEKNLLFVKYRCFNSFPRLNLLADSGNLVRCDRFPKIETRHVTVATRDRQRLKFASTPRSQLNMSSQQHLKESLRSLGYCPSDKSEIPDLPASCLCLISTLVDDMTHSQTRITRLETELDEANDRSRKLNIQVANYVCKV